MATRYAAGAAGLPFGVLRGYVGTDLLDHTSTIKPIECPFTGEQLTAVPALNPDVSIVHAQRADRDGNVQIWGLVGVQKEAVLAAKRSIVTVEEIVDTLEPVPNSIVLPTWVITRRVRGARRRPPELRDGLLRPRQRVLPDWDAISKDRDAFTDWMNANVLGTGDHAEYLAKIGVTVR